MTRSNTTSPFWKNATALAFALFAFAPATSAAAPIRIASLAPQDSSWGKLLRELADEARAATGGSVDFKLFLGGKLGDESKVSKKLGHGLDGAFLTGQGIGHILPAFRVQELPFLCETYEEADKVRTALWPLLVEAFEKETKLVLLGTGETGMVYLMSKPPLATLEDMTKAKLWVWEGDKVASDTFKVFGVSPRPLDILTVVQQLKAGAIDTVYASPAGAVALGWTGDLQHVTGRSFAYAAGGVVVTKEAWSAVSPEARETARNIVAKYGEKIVQQTRKDNDAALARLIGAGGGLKQVPIADEKYREFKKVAIDAWPKLAAAIGASDLLPKARAAVGK